MKRALRITRNFFITLIVLIVVFFGALQLPLVQRFIIQKTLNWIKKEYAIDAQVRSTSIAWFSKQITIKGLHILDHQKKNLLYIGHLKLRYKSFSRQHLNLDRVSIDGFKLDIERYPADSIGNLLTLLSPFKTDQKSDPSPFKINIQSIDLRNLFFSYHDRHVAPRIEPNSVDFSHIDLDSIELQATDFVFKDGHILAQIQQLGCQVRSSFHLKKFKALASMTPTRIEALKAEIQTNSSEIEMDYAMDFESMADFRDFVNKVSFDSKIRYSQINMDDIAYFAPAMKGMNNRIDLQANVKGPVRDLHVNDLNFLFGGHSHFTGQVHMNGLPNFFNTRFNIQIAQCQTGHKDLTHFYLPKGLSIPLPSALSVLDSIELQGVFDGTFLDFTSQLSLQTKFGNLYSDIHCSYTANEKSRHFISNYSLDNARVTPWVDNPLVERFSSEGNFEFFTLPGHKPKAHIDGHIRNWISHGESVEDMHFIARLIDGELSTEFHVQDPALKLDMELLANIDEGFEQIDLFANIDHINLSRFQIFPDSLEVRMSGQIAGRVNTLDIDNLDGALKINQFVLKTRDSVYHMKEFTALQRITAQGKNTQVLCDYFSVNLSGYYDYRAFKTLAYDFETRFLDFIDGISSDSLDLNQINTIVNQQRFSLDLSILKGGGLLEFFLPEISLGKGSNIRMYHDNTKEIEYFCQVQIPKGQIGPIFVDALNIQGQGRQQQFTTRIESKVFSIGHAIPLSHLKMRADLDNAKLNWQLAWHSDSVGVFTGDMAGQIQFKSLQQINAQILKAQILVNHKPWHIEANNHFYFDHGEIQIHRFKFSRTDQNAGFIGLDGAISKDSERSLSVSAEQFNLDILNTITDSVGFNITGLLSGQLRIYSLLDKPHFESNLKIHQFGINHFNYGTASLQAQFDLEREGMKVGFNIRDDGIFKTEYMNVSGFFYPRRNGNNFDLGIQLNGIDLSLIRRFVNSFSSAFDGSAYGNLSLTGSLNKPNLYGELNVHNGSLLIDFTQALYQLETCELDFSLDGIHFRDVRLYSENSSARSVLTGDILWNRFSNIRIDLGLEANNLLALNTRYQDNDAFFGKAYVTGIATLKGPANSLLLDVAARTDKETFIQIPYSDKVSITNTDFIRFIQPESEKKETDPNEEAPIVSSNFGIRINAEITPDAVVVFDMNTPPANGVIRASGSGVIRLEMPINKPFQMFGDYALTEGYYNFNFQNILDRRFNIERGSVIKWTGNPGDAAIDLNAVYSTRASLYPIFSANYIGDGTGENLKNKVNVQSVIHLGGRLTRPEIQFDIRLPNVDEDTRTQFFSLVNNDNEGEMTKQTFYLLTVNAFTPISSNTTSGSAIPGSNTAAGLTMTAATEILSNQISNILSLLVNDLDLGVGYKPRDENNAQQVQVNVSTQLFNDKLIINGNLGVGGGSLDVPTTNTELVGDFDAEYRVTERISLRAFSRSNERDVMRTENYNTQGVGVSYRREADSFWRLFYNKERRKKRAQSDSLSK